MPHAERPYMPGYGVQPAAAGSGLLPWPWAEAKLWSSHDYWLGSICPDGRPHLMPVWGVWMNDGLWFSSAAGSRKARNLLADGRCTAAIDDALNPVVLEGFADLRTGVDDRSCYLEASNAKYSVDYGLDFLDGVANVLFRVLPMTAFGMLHEDFTGSPTRWTFAPGE
jgi:hypothetical protein